MRRTWLAGLMWPTTVVLLAGPLPEVRFTDITRDSGIAFQHENAPTLSKYLIETMGGGVALLDADGDSRLDLFFTNGARLLDPMPPGAQPEKREPRFWNRLYRNRGGGSFTDVTERAGLSGGRGYTMGVAVADYDNDGRSDLYLTQYGSNVLFHNEGEGRFRDVTAAAGVGGGGWSSSAGFFDYDNDGWLDLFVCRYVEFSFAGNPHCGDRRPGYREYCHPRSFPAVANLLFRNNGDGTFREVSAETGVARLRGKALGVAFADYDGDGFTDVFVANDSEPGMLLRNVGGRRFEDVAEAAGVAVNGDGAAVAGMGVDFADYDDDGLPDLFITTLSGETYSLYRNEGGGRFAFLTTASGVGEASVAYSGWGTRFLDFDNDGRKDVFAAQGHVLDTIELTSDHVKYAQPPLLLRGLGGRFANVGRAAGPDVARPWPGRGAATGDFDDDGDTDVLVGSCGARPVLLRNDGGNRRAWLGLRLIGKRSNRDGAGCRVKLVTPSGRVQHHAVSTAASYQSASDPRLLIGLGDEPEAALVEVRWPSGAVQRLERVPARRLLTLTEPVP